MITLVLVLRHSVEYNNNTNHSKLQIIKSSAHMWWKCLDKLDGRNAAIFKREGGGGGAKF